MVEVGSIEVAGSIQTDSIDVGLRRIETGMKNVSDSSKGVQADFTRISIIGGNLIKGMGTLAIAGTGAMIAMAKGAPAVAGSMARINLSMLKLKMSAGEALQPLFEEGANALEKLVRYVDANPVQVRWIAGAGLAAIGAGIAGKLGLGAGLTGVGAGVGAGGIAGGAIVGGAIMSEMARSSSAEKVWEILDEKGAGAVKQGFAGFLGGQFFGPAGGSLSLVQAIQNSIRKLINKQSRQSSELDLMSYA